MNIELIKQKAKELMDLLNEDQPQEELKQTLQARREARQNNLSRFAGAIAKNSADNHAQRVVTQMAEQSKSMIRSYGWIVPDQRKEWAGWEVYQHEVKGYFMFVAGPRFVVKHGSITKVDKQGVSDLKATLEAVKNGLV